MAATGALPSSYQTPNLPPPSLKSSSSAALVSVKPHKKNHNSIRCDITSPNSPVHFFTNNTSPEHLPVPMASESAVKMAKKVCLFYCAETKELAQKVAAESDGIELRSITWRKFADGFPNIFIPNAHAIRGQHVAFLASFNSPSVIFEQLSVIYALPKLFIASFTLVLPFFPTGTSERMEDEGDVATAFTLARALSNIPISMGAGRLPAQSRCPQVCLDVPDLAMSFVFEEELRRERKEGDKCFLGSPASFRFRRSRGLSLVWIASSRSQEPFHVPGFRREARRRENRREEDLGFSGEDSTDSGDF